MSEDLNTQTREISPDQGNHAARIRDRSPAVSTRFTGKLSWTCTRDIRASAEARGLAGRSAFTPAIAQAACLAAQCGAGRPGPSCSRRVAGRPGAGSPSVIEGAARQTRYPPLWAVMLRGLDAVVVAHNGTFAPSGMRAKDPAWVLRRAKRWLPPA